MHPPRMAAFLFSFMGPASALLNRMGIDRGQLLTLLGVYLKQDFRRQGGTLSFGKAEAIVGNKAVLMLIAVYVFMGLMIGIVDLTLRLDVYVYSMVLLS